MTARPSYPLVGFPAVDQRGVPSRQFALFLNEIWRRTSDPAGNEIDATRAAVDGVTVDYQAADAAVALKAANDNAATLAVANAAQEAADAADDKATGAQQTANAAQATATAAEATASDAEQIARATRNRFNAHQGATADVHGATGTLIGSGDVATTAARGVVLQAAAVGDAAPAAPAIASPAAPDAAGTYTQADVQAMVDLINEIRTDYAAAVAEIGTLGTILSNLTTRLRAAGILGESDRADTTTITADTTAYTADYASGGAGTAPTTLADPWDDGVLWDDNLTWTEA